MSITTIIITTLAFTALGVTGAILVNRQMNRLIDDLNRMALPV